MSEMRLELPDSTPPSPPPMPPEPGQPGGSLAAGVGLAWAVMIVGEVLAVMTHNFGAMLVGMLLPPVAIIVWGLVLLRGRKPRTGKGLLLGLLSIVAVVLLLVAACFGLISANH